MTDLLSRKLEFDKTLYSDAANLTPDAWIEKYKIHPDYEREIRYYRVEEGRANFNTNVDPKLFQGFTRLFLLGIQLASEEKGHGGALPAKKLELGGSWVPLAGGGMARELCATIGSVENSIVMTKGFVEKLLRDGEYQSYIDTTHMPDRHLDPFQAALVTGVEEGLHSESLKVPGNVEIFSRENKVQSSFPQKDDPSARGKYAELASEEYIHEDLVRICERINPQYALGWWQSFTRSIAPGL